MLWEIIKKEFHSNIITARFILGFAICLMLIAGSTYVAIQDHSRRLNDYNTAVREHRDEALKVNVYRELYPRVDRKPKRMSIFSQGMDKRLANSFEIYTTVVPAIYDGEKYGAYNEFLSLFPSVDLAFIFGVVLSLLALLFAYDAISGEQEDGTLKLMMSNSIPRSSVLLGKYLSALLSLFWPIAVSIIVALLMMMRSDKVSLARDDFLRILLIVIASLLYVSLFYLVGLLISTKTRRTATSLMVGMFVWVFLTLIYPNAGGFLADQVIRSEPGMEQYSQLRELWSEFKRERERYEKKVVPEYSYWGTMISGWGSEYSPKYLYYRLREYRTLNGGIVQESALDALRRFYGHVEPLHIKTADQAWQMRKRVLDETYGRKQRLTMNILRVSPAAIYQNASAILASTDLGSMEDFMDQVRQYRRSFIQYLYDQEAFSSAYWFRYYHDEEKGILDRPDVSGLPILHERDESIVSSLGRGAVDMVLLFVLNVVFFILSHTLFIRQEVR